MNETELKALINTLIDLTKSKELDRQNYVNLIYKSHDDNNKRNRYVNKQNALLDFTENLESVIISLKCMLDGKECYIRHDRSCEKYLTNKEIIKYV